MLNIITRVNDAVVFHCGYIYLEPYAPNTGRKFTFSDFKAMDGEIEFNDIVNIEISVINKNNEVQHLIQFDFFVVNHSFSDENNKWLYGNIANLELTEFRQGIINVFYTWSKGQQFDWFAIPVSSSYLKLDYISACMIYDGVYTNINHKSHYIFDMSLIKEERDFFYLASLEFIGNRSYMGHDLHTFKDCFSTLLNDFECIKGKTIIFENINDVTASEIKVFIDDIRLFFQKNGICVADETGHDRLSDASSFLEL